MKKKIFYTSIILISLFFAKGSYAGLFPNDAKTVYKELEGPSSFALLNGGTARTVLGFSIQQSGTASDSFLMCGGSIIAKNYAKDLPFNQVSYFCDSNVNVSKTGNDNASFIITYVDYNIASSTQEYATSSPNLMSNNIENIGYISTTTIISSGVSTTSGTYFIPFYLFLFILAILVIILAIVLSLVFYNRKKI